VASRVLDDDTILRAEKMLAEGANYDLIATELGIGQGTISRIKKGIQVNQLKRGKQPSKQVDTPEPGMHENIRKMLKHGALSESELADELDCGPSKVRQAIKEMKAKGVMLLEAHGKYDLKESIHIEPGKTTMPGGNRIFGALGDNHLCNKHSRLDVLKAAYETYERLGITDVFNTGNWIDGEARFNKTELITRPGMDAQIEYMIDNYPQFNGITTHYIAGDDHEGWYQQREGVEIGRYLQLKAEESGRSDLRYLGYGECDVKLQARSGSAAMRVVHPGGGSSYAISYTDQKRVESYQGGEKPQIELAGHYHKASYSYPREVHCVQTACTEDQTMFMRKKRLQAHVGYWVINLTQADDGSITRFAPEFYPFYDRAYYRKDF
jgi:biotin operon repressor